MVKFFENTKTNNVYYIDENTFQIFKRKNNGSLSEVKTKQSKYGLTVNLYIFYDEKIERCRNRDVYLHTIIGDYIFNAKRKYIIGYKDNNIYNCTKENVYITYLSDLNKKWCKIAYKESTYLSNNGDVYYEPFKCFILPFFDVNGYAIISLNGKGIKRSHLVWEYFGNKPFKEGYVVDHIDNNPSNDNINNLQLITFRENTIKDLNKKTNLPIGVRKDCNKFKSYISYTINGLYYDNVYLGSFDSVEMASDCYKRALSLVKDGINPIKNGDNKNIKYKFSIDKWYYIMPSDKGRDKYIGDFESYDKALKSYNNHINELEKFSNESDEERVVRKGRFSFKYKGISYDINKRKFGDIEFINAFNFYKECKKNDNVQEFINNIPLIREKIYNEHNKICELLKKKNKEEKAIRYVEYLDKIKNDKLKKETLNSKIKDEMNLVKELLRESKMIEFMNKPNYIQNSYNDCYTINVPYKDGKYYYLHSFKNKEIVDEIDNIINEYKQSNNFINLFNDFKSNKLPSYVEKDNVYRQQIESQKKNKLGYCYLPKKDLYRVKKRLNNKEYVLGYYKDERCCKYILDECNNAIKLGIFSTWYNDIEKHKLRVRNMFNDLTLNRSRNIAFKNKLYLE